MRRLRDHNGKVLYTSDESSSVDGASTVSSDETIADSNQRMASFLIGLF